jgi:hypothetical protein
LNCVETAVGSVSKNSQLEAARSDFGFIDTIFPYKPVATYQLPPSQTTLIRDKLHLNQFPLRVVSCRRSKTIQRRLLALENAVPDN